MTKTRPNRKLVAGFLALVLMLSLGFSLYRGLERHEEDQSYKAVQVLVNYDDIRQFANLSRQPLEAVARAFKAAGATGVLVKERTLSVGVVGAQNALVQSQDAVVMSGVDLKKEAALRNELVQAEDISPRNTYLWIENPVLRQSVFDHIKAKNGYGALLQYQGMTLIDAGPVDGNLLTMGVGYPVENLKAIADQGLTVSPQIKSWPIPSDTSIQFVVSDVLKLPNIHGVYFNDDKISMFDHPEMTRLVKAQTVGFIEFFSAGQKGLETLIRSTEAEGQFNVKRMHAIGASQMLKEKPQRNIEQFKLAVSERDIRAVYMAFPFSGDIVRDQENATSFIKDLIFALKDDGYQVQVAVPAYNLSPSPIWFIWIIGLAAVAGTAFLGMVLQQEKWGYALALLGLLGWSGLLVLKPSIAKQLMAIYACTLFPTLGILWSLRLAPRTLTRALAAFVICSGFSLMGALVQIGLLTENAYVMGLDIFRGVKVVLVLPMVLVLLAVLIRWETFDLQKIKNFLSRPVNVVSLAALGILAVVVFVYVRRSGNTGTVSDLEIMFRQALDQILGVRPRTKEFLAGHPAMLVALYFGYKKRWLPFVLLGAIGQVSMVNTFSHFHTPILVSVIRTFHGLWIGLVIGMAALACYQVVLRLIPDLWKKEIQNV